MTVALFYKFQVAQPKIQHFTSDWPWKDLTWICHGIIVSVLKDSRLDLVLPHKETGLDLARGVKTWTSDLTWYSCKIIWDLTGTQVQIFGLETWHGEKDSRLVSDLGKKKKTCDHPWYPIGRIDPFQFDWQSRPAGKNKNKFHLPCDDPATWNSPAVTFGERRDFRINNTVKSRLVHHSAELTLWKRWLYPQVHQMQPW